MTTPSLAARAPDAAAPPRGRRWRRGAGAAVVLALVGALAPVLPAHADSIRDAQYWLAEYGITQAWSTSKGKGVRVAVIDSGVDGSHPDLQGAVVGGADMSGLGSKNGQKGVGSSPEHGTLVASVLAGRGHGGSNGVIGVAPEADLLTVSVAFGVTGVDTDQQIADAIIWAVDHDADVINMSLTRNNPDWPRSWDDAFLYAFEHDVVIVAAAGNRISGTTQVGAPATIPGVLTVAGLDRSGEASTDASSQGITISVAAPSEELVGAMPGTGYAGWQGTSGSAPIVSGLVALIRAEYPDLDAANVIQRVIATADAQSATLPDPLYGYGKMDARRALTANVAAVTENPMGDLAEWIRVYRRADPPSSTPDPEQTETEDPDAAPADPEDPDDPDATSGSTDPDEDPDAAAAPTDPFASAGDAYSRQAGSAPVIVLVGFGVLFVLLMVGAGRHFWRILRRE